MTEKPSNSLASYLDSLDLEPKRTGVAAHVEIVAYPDGHTAIGSHPLNDRAELLKAVGYLFDRAHEDASARKGSAN
jgi:hypothetical protein